MNQRMYMTVTAAIFLAVGIIHLLRIVFAWHAQIGEVTVPMWASWVALPVSAAIAYFGFTLKR
jgi:hypothetical protein